MNFHQLAQVSLLFHVHLFITRATVFPSRISCGHLPQCRSSMKNASFKISWVLGGIESASYIFRHASRIDLMMVLLVGTACPQRSEKFGCIHASYMTRSGGDNTVCRYIASILIPLISTFIVRWVLLAFFLLLIVLKNSYGFPS